MSTSGKEGLFFLVPQPMHYFGGLRLEYEIYDVLDGVASYRHEYARD